MLTPLSILSLEQGKIVYLETTKIEGVQPDRRFEAVVQTAADYLRRFSVRLVPTTGIRTALSSGTADD